MKIIFSIIKRFIFYPFVVGGSMYMFVFGDPINQNDSFKVSFFENLYQTTVPLGFDIIPDQFYTYLSFYFIGYSYGVISKYFGVRKFKRGLILSFLIFCSKFVIITVMLPIAPFIFIGNIIKVLIDLIKLNKKNKQNRSYLPQHQTVESVENAF